MIKKKGFTLLEVTIVLGIGTLIAFMKFQDMRNNQEAVLADNVGTQIKQLGEAVNRYISIDMTRFPHCHHPTIKVAIRGQEHVRLLVVKSLTRR
ncbi:prepilin-type N-terminal cleavage/methylation domain-containing protein [Escherichia coli]|nr:prepilin-type N-terminal cleavage/methylation domain-containing protein [Escherichia coli]EIK8146381.1 prepilin-type N-terminal cleavage/methylation domain-containing protein [Escherichia coli]EJH3635964.1 prepilin-type N-terminal cleavage/methylation domain-containing protein [Escherichia coli]EKK2542526.1 prepilin-type N-terminal cleavage/methylation domain-containing protein [Escherichia coli]EKY6175878.1 prepilin-type N-terminal cleavage/methylation domain-containing protein [Escherichia